MRGAFSLRGFTTCLAERLKDCGDALATVLEMDADEWEVAICKCFTITKCLRHQQGMEGEGATWDIKVYCILACNLNKGTIVLTALMELSR
jgi:hypothetical protein